MNKNIMIIMTLLFVVFSGCGSSMLVLPLDNINDTNIANDTTYSSFKIEELISNVTGGTGTETDPVFSSSPASFVTSQNLIDWTSAFNWGNHATQGYIKNYTENDTIALTQIRPILNETNEIFSTGLVSGGILVKNANASINISSGIGYINDDLNTYHQRINWTAKTNVNSVTAGLNYVGIDINGNVYVSSAKLSQNYIKLGSFYVDSAQTMMIEVFSVPEYIGNIGHRVNEFVADAIGTLVASGNYVSESTSFKLSISGGIMYSKLGNYSQLDTTNFTKMYNTADLGWIPDTSNLNSVNVTLWNNQSKNYSSALVSMTTGNWKKDLVIRLTNGNVYYIYGQQEYPTEDLAKAGVLPTIPSEISENAAYLSMIISTKNDTTISSRIYDIRPLLDRIFGYGTAGSSGAVITHSALTGLANDDHTQYFNQVRGDARYYLNSNPNNYFNNIANFTTTLTNNKLCIYNSTSLKIQCDYTDQTGTGGAGDGTGGWINTSYTTKTNLSIYQYGNNATYFKTAGNARIQAMFEEFGLVVATYQRITTAPTIELTETSQTGTLINFPSAATALSDGGYVMAGSTATNAAIIDPLKISVISTKAKFVATTTRGDIIGAFTSATTLVQTTALTGVFFIVQNSTASTTQYGMVCNAGTCSNVTIGAIDTNWHEYTIISDSNETNVATKFTFYYDGINKGTINTNLPATQVSTVGTWTEAKTAVAVTLRLDWYNLEIYR